jgi:hypothetical protein
MENCKQFYDCCMFYGPPVRYEICNATKDGYFGVKMVIKEYERRDEEEGKRERDRERREEELERKKREDLRTLRDM